MVHLVIVQAPPIASAHISTALRDISSGFYPLGNSQYIVVTNAAAGSLRDWIRTLGATQTTVLRLQGQWGTSENPDLAQWLRNAAGHF